MAIKEQSIIKYDSCCLCLISKTKYFLQTGKICHDKSLPKVNVYCQWQGFAKNGGLPSI